jgi:hypothetical protein
VKGESSRDVEFKYSARLACSLAFQPPSTSSLNKVQTLFTTF